MRTKYFHTGQLKEVQSLYFNNEEEEQQLVRKRIAPIAFIKIATSDDCKSTKTLENTLKTWVLRYVGQIFN